MATQQEGQQTRGRRGRQAPTEGRDPNQSPFLYFRADCTWMGEVGGTTALRPTLPDHMLRVLEQAEERLRREQRRRPASQVVATGATEQAVASASETSASDSAEAEQPQPEHSANGNGETDAQVEERVLSMRQQWLQEALEDELLDDDAKQIIQEVLQEGESPGEMLARVVGRATTTFPRDEETGEFYIPNTWWMEALQVAAEDFMGLFREQAQRLKKRIVSIYPQRLYLGVDRPDLVREINVQLETVRPGQAQASIKRIQFVRPRQEDFTLVFKVLDSPVAQELIRQMRGVIRTMGESAGVGGGRPQYGKFTIRQVTQMNAEDGEERIAEISVQSSLERRAD